jgi:hypothetical protein
MSINLTELQRLINTARALNEPLAAGGAVSEYVRGQVNLINDYAGLPGGADYYHDLLADVITDKITVAEFMFQLGLLMSTRGERDD